MVAPSCAAAEREKGERKLAAGFPPSKEIGVSDKNEISLYLSNKRAAARPSMATLPSRTHA